MYKVSPADGHHSISEEDALAEEKKAENGVAVLLGTL